MAAPDLTTTLAADPTESAEGLLRDLRARAEGLSSHEAERRLCQFGPIESQVRRVAWLIALIAVCMGVAFIPIAMFRAGLSIGDSVVSAVGLLVGNVPEGLLPVITLAPAVGVRGLVREGAVVKRLSAVETLRSRASSAPARPAPSLTTG